MNRMLLVSMLAIAASQGLLAHDDDTFKITNETSKRIDFAIVDEHDKIHEGYHVVGKAKEDKKTKAKQTSNSQEIGGLEVAGIIIKKVEGVK